MMYSAVSYLNILQHTVLYGMMSADLIVSSYFQVHHLRVAALDCTPIHNRHNHDNGIKTGFCMLALRGQAAEST